MPAKRRGIAIKCSACGQEFNPWHGARRRFCSPACYYKSRHNSTEYFWNKVRKTDGCWLWSGWRDDNGYGGVSFQGSPWKSHRLAYTLAVGEIPTGLAVLHKCDTPACCNPDHLFLGTQLDNIADATNKHRVRNGVKHHAAKLDPDRVREMRHAYASGGDTLASLAKRFGVDYKVVWRIVNRTGWRHVT